MRIEKLEVTSVTVSLAEQPEIQSAQQFYNAEGYRGDPITIEDRVFLARNAHEIVGIGRLCNEHGFWCLRGMRIRLDYQRQGIGTIILGQIVASIGDAPCYCLPYTHLAMFYGQAGFQLKPFEDLPDYLQIRVQEYTRRNISVIGMARLPQSS